MKEYGAYVEWYLQGKTEVLEENPAPLPLGPQQIPREVAWYWTWEFAVRDRRLTARTMERSLSLSTP
jgi:hypothetical protein